MNIRSRGARITSKLKGRKPTLDTDKNIKGQQHNESKVGSPSASHDSDNMGGGEEPVNLTLILIAIRDFRQDSKKNSLKISKGKSQRLMRSWTRPKQGLWKMKRDFKTGKRY